MTQQTFFGRPSNLKPIHIILGVWGVLGLIVLAIASMVKEKPKPAVANQPAPQTLPVPSPVASQPVVPPTTTPATSPRPAPKRSLAKGNLPATVVIDQFAHGLISWTGEKNGIDPKGTPYEAISPPDSLISSGLMDNDYDRSRCLVVIRVWRRKSDGKVARIEIVGDGIKTASHEKMVNTLRLMHGLLEDILPEPAVKEFFNKDETTMKMAGDGAVLPVGSAILFARFVPNGNVVFAITPADDFDRQLKGKR